MKTRMPILIGMTVIVGLCVTAPALAQDLGPDVKKLADGVYVYSKDYDSNVGIIITQDGVVLIDTDQNPNESLVVMDLVQKLTPQPVRYIINTEPHGDHTSGNFVFSPPASVIAAAGECSRGPHCFAAHRIRGQNDPQTGRPHGGTS